MADFERDGVRIFYLDHGGSGPALIFSHGILMDHEMFDPQVETLREEFRCVTWDSRGHGATEAGDPFTYWDSAGDLVGLIDHLGIDHAFLVGMSQGGFACLRAALKAPERVLGLILIDTQAGPEDPQMLPAYDSMLEDFKTNGVTDALAESVASIILAPADPSLWIAKWKARPPSSVEHLFGALTAREDIHDRLKEITCPALVVHGTLDPAISMEKAEALCAGLPRCDGLVRVDGGGHASNLTHPGVVTEALRDFCRRYS